MTWRRSIVAVAAGAALIALVMQFLWYQLMGVVQEVAAWVLPRIVPDTGYSLIVDLVALFIVAIPGVALGIALYAKLRGPGDGETRCRKCGYILRGLTNPRCPECGQTI